MAGEPVFFDELAFPDELQLREQAFVDDERRAGRRALAGGQVHQGRVLNPDLGNLAQQAEPCRLLRPPQLIEELLQFGVADALRSSPIAVVDFPFDEVPLVARHRCDDGLAGGREHVEQQQGLPGELDGLGLPVDFDGEHVVEVARDVGWVHGLEFLRVDADDQMRLVLDAEDEVAALVVGEGGDGPGVLLPACPVEAGLELQPAALAGNQPARLLRRHLKNLTQVHGRERG